MNNTDPMLENDMDKEIQIATATSRNVAKWRNQSMKISEFVEKLLSTTRTPETVAQYFAYPKSEQDNIKDVGGYVGGTLKNGSRSKHNVANRHIITLDADFADKGFIEKTKKVLSGLCFTLSSTHKHTEENYRLRLVVYPDRPMLPDEYLAASRILANRIGMDYFDDTTYDTNRLMYWPSTSSDGVFYAEHFQGDYIKVEDLLLEYGSNAEWKDANNWPQSSRETKNFDRLLKKQEDPLKKRGMVGAVCRAIWIHDAIMLHTGGAYSRGTNNRYTYVDGSSSNGLIVYDDKYAYSEHATDPATKQLCNAFDLIRIHKFGHLDKNSDTGTKAQSYKAMCEWAKEIPEVKLQLTKMEAEDNEDTETMFSEFVDADEKEESSREWLTKLDVADNGQILGTFLNAILIIENDEKLNKQMKFNDFAMRMEHSRSGEIWKSTDTYEIRKYLGAKYHVDFSENKVKHAIEYVAGKNRHHPIKEYLNGLEWDFEERVETLFIDYLGCEDNQYTREAAKCFLLAAVRRIYTPGYKFDSVPVLGGAQGIGKSSFFKILATRDDWFGELTTFDLKVAQEQMNGKWILELGELGATNKTQIEQQKAFISATSATVRPAYGDYPIEYKRQCVLTGTTNETEYLKDSTGNRRWWPIDSGLPEGVEINLTKLRENIDQIWAEVVFLHSIDETTLLSKEARELAQNKQHEKKEQDEWEGIINAWLKTEARKDRYDSEKIQQDDVFSCAEKEERDRTCVIEIWEDCLKMFGMPKPYDRKRIGAIMDNNKEFDKKTSIRFGTRYGRQRGWIKNDTPF